MNSYISNFKKYTLLIFLLLISFIVFLDVILYYYADMKTDKNRFISNKFSKGKHMLLNTTNAKDYIFIGSSRTLFHISTGVFMNKGVNVYNFGVSDRKIFDYPYMVNRVIELKNKPKSVVISIKKSDLYEEYEDHFNSISIDDIFAMSKIYDTDVIIRAFISYIKNIHKLVIYSEPIYLNIRSLYDKFRFEVRSEVRNNNERVGLSEVKRLDCDIFDYKYPSPVKIVAKCTNGDGVLLGNNINYSLQRRDEDSKIVNIKVRELLNQTLKVLNNNNIRAVLIFEPTLTKDNRKIPSGINADLIIDLSNFKFPDKYWADSDHFNVYGRKAYSEILVNKLKSRNLTHIDKGQ